jgi:hypothetical protein
MGRLATSQNTNPEHKLSKLADGFSWGEMASFFEIMADGTTGTVEKKFIEYWLSMLGLFISALSLHSDRADANLLTTENERLPTKIGWQRRTKTMRGTERVTFTEKLMQAAGVAKRDVRRDAYNREVKQ